MVQTNIPASHTAGRLLGERPPHVPFLADRDIVDIHRRVSACVTGDFGVTAAELGFGSRGSPQAALARQVAMYLCHTGFALGFGTIGKLFGRDRTTVAHACRVVEDRRDDIWFDCRITALELACGLPLAAGGAR